MRQKNDLTDLIKMPTPSVLKYKTFQYFWRVKVFKCDQTFREDHKNIWHQPGIL